jgi:hypothetical protein
VGLFIEIDGAWWSPVPLSAAGNQSSPPPTARSFGKTRFGLCFRRGALALPIMTAAQDSQGDAEER